MISLRLFFIMYIELFRIQLTTTMHFPNLLCSVDSTGEPQTSCLPFVWKPSYYKSTLSSSLQRANVQPIPAAPLCFNGAACTPIEWRLEILFRNAIGATRRSSSNPTLHSSLPTIHAKQHFAGASKRAMFAHIQCLLIWRLWPARAIAMPWHRIENDQQLANGSPFHAGLR